MEVFCNLIQIVFATRSPIHLEKSTLSGRKIVRVSQNLDPKRDKIYKYNKSK